MELLQLLNITLIFVAIKAAINNLKNNWNANELQHFNESLIIPSENFIDFKTFIEDDHYNYTSIYKKFRSYIDKQHAKNNFVFEGTFVSFFKVTAKTNTICLDILNLKINKAATSVTIDDKKKMKPMVFKPKIHIYDKETQMVMIHFDQYLLPSTSYRLRMEFIGPIISTGSFYRTSNTKVWLIAASDSEGMGTGLILPYWNECYTKAKFIITIIHHGNYKVLTNTIFKTTYIENMRSYFYSEINTFPHLIGIVFHNLDHISNETDTFNENQTIDIWGRRNIKQRFEFVQYIAVKSKLYLQENFAVKSKLYLQENSELPSEFPSNMNIIIIPNFREETIESWRLVFYNEAAVMYDETIDPIAYKMNVAHTVARKMTYQFFGNMIGQTWGSYLWINEGVATFLGMKIIDKIIPDSRMLDLFVVQFQHECLRLNHYYDMPFVEIIESLYFTSTFPFTRYVKASVFIHMLSKIVPTDVFMISLSEYVRLHQGTFFDTVDSLSNKFLNIFHEIYMRHIILEKRKTRSIDLEKRLNCWITQKYFPVLEVTLKSSKTLFEIKLSQNMSRPNCNNLWIPVKYVTSHNKSQTEWLSHNKPILHVPNIEEKHWIIVNIQQSGYYRVKYDKKLWEKILYSLHSTSPDIHPLNRAQFIDDAYYFLLTKKLDFVFFKRLTSYLSKETDYIPWYPLFKIMEDISGFLPFRKSNNVKLHFRTLFDSILEYLTYDESVHDTAFNKSLRQEAAKWACILDSHVCKYTAVFTLTAHLNESLSESDYKGVLPYWKSWTYCKGLQIADSHTWDRVFEIAKTDKEIIEFLACSKDRYIIYKYIEKIRHLNRIEDRITALHSIFAKQLKNNYIFNYILKNFANLIPIEIGVIAGVIDIINHIYSEEQLDKVKNSVFPNVSLKEISYIHQKIEKRLFEIQKHVSFFERFLKTE